MGANERTLLDSRMRARHKAVASNMTDGEFFEYFTSELILKNYQPALEGLLYGLVDGTNDCGVDGFFTFVNGQQSLPGARFDSLKRNAAIDCIITQSKTSERFSEQVIEKFAFHLPKLLSFDRDESSVATYANPRLIEVTRALLDTCTELAPINPRITFYVYYASRGDDVHPNVRSKAEHVPTLLRQLFPGCAAYFNFLGSTELLQYAQDSASISRSLPMAEGSLTSDATGGQGYLCLTRLEDYYGFIRDDHGLNALLFEANVRDHEGDTDVNKSIRETLNRDQPAEDFWWLNNGITIVAPEVNQMGKTLHMRDPQIVNGLQTSNEIFRHFTDGGGGGDRKLLVRVVAAEDDLVRDKIIRATNNQNQLPGSALRATDRIQHNIEEYFVNRGFYYDRRKNYYHNQGMKLDRIVSMESVGQSVASCLLRAPWIARSRYGSMLEDDLYPQLFADSYPLNMYLNCILLLRRVKSALAESPVIQHGQVEDWCFHVATVAAMLRTRRARPQARDLANADFTSIPLPRLAELQYVVAREFARMLTPSSYKPMSAVASNEQVSEALIRRVENLLVSSRWRRWPDEPVDEDSAILTSDVFYGRPGRS